MKRFICCVLLALAILPLAALGEEMPQEVKTLYQADAGGVETASDVLNLRDAAGSAWCLIAEDGGGTWGYRQNASGEWACEWSGSLWPDGGDARFVREGETAFRVESESLNAWMRYESRGAGFYLTAWRDGGAYRGYAVIGNGNVTFFPDGGREKEVIPIGEELRNWLYAFDSLAKTPEEMRARAAIGREAAAALLPGWTMAWYESFNDGTEADAAFYRVEGGKLTVRRVSLSSEKGKIWETESLAVPLSAALLQRLETQGAAGLLDGSGYGSTFLTEDAWDREIIPIQGKILANDLQSHCLLALTEREGERRIAVAEMDEKGAWQVRESRPLPSGAGLDLGVFRYPAIILIGVVYILVRCVGKYTGALLGSSLMRCGDTVRRYLGITLFPQAGVALGMVVTAQALGAQMGGLVRNIVLFSVLVYELIGPQMTRMALTSAGEIKAGADDAGNRARFKKKEKISGNRHWRRSHQR